MNQIRLARPTLQLIERRWRAHETKEDLQSELNSIQTSGSILF